MKIVNNKYGQLQLQRLQTTIKVLQNTRAAQWAIDESIHMEDMGARKKKFKKKNHKKANLNKNN